MAKPHNQNNVTCAEKRRVLMIGKLLLLLCVSYLVFMPLKSHGADKESVQRQSTTDQKEQRMDLGNFSVSLAVKDIEASKAFYEKLGFKVFTGDAAQKWLIMKNGDHVIGLFQGMFEKNILTFNPGWDSNAQNLSTFTDVRDLQRQLKAKGVKLLKEADENSTGPASFMTVDPDGNQILVDQHR
jgi:lactoylglutathione lyase